MVRRLWAGTVELAEAHQALGHEVWLISATPVEVSQVIAHRLGLTGGMGTIAEVEDGRYTGRLDGLPLHGSAKVAQVEALAERRGLDLARCAAYSDSSNDIPMLTLVGYPVAVNPDGRLRSHARGMPGRSGTTGSAGTRRCARASRRRPPGLRPSASPSESPRRSR